ncbi:Boron transporter-like protein 2 [Hordeum vulgare]|nr:Boron transporter-like protein 2 [Hordeum vulgare]
MNVQKWEVPKIGWTKVNADGAMTKSGVKGGGGVVLRGHNGAFLAGGSHFFGNVRDAEAAEVLACRQAVLLARQRGIAKIHLELDNKGLVGMLKDQHLNLATVGPLDLGDQITTVVL